MSTTLSALRARVYAIIGVNPGKEASGQYGEGHVIVALNTAQRFISKSAPVASLGDLVKTAEHPIVVATTRGTPSFNKTSTAGGRLLAVVKDTDFSDRVPIKSFDEWMDTASTEGLAVGDVRTYYAVELGRKVYIRPFPPILPITFVEIYVDDTTDMVNLGDFMSMNDEWKEWVALCAAQIIALNANNYEKMGVIDGLMKGWSAQFRSVYGMNPPAIQAPVQAGREV